MVGARTDIGFKVYRTVGIAAGIVLIQSARAIPIDVWLGDAKVDSSAGKQPHTARSKILRRCQKVGRQFMINRKAPGFDVQVTAPVALQGSRLLKIDNVAPEAAQVRGCLLISRQEGRARAGWVKIYERGEPVAFEAGVEVIVLCCTVVNSKTCSNHGLSVECTRCPRHANTRIKVLVVGVIQRGILRAGRCVDGRWEWAVNRSRSQADSMKFIEIENRGAVVCLVGHSVILPT